LDNFAYFNEKSDVVDVNACGLVLEKYCIFLNADDSLRVEMPASFKLVKLTNLDVLLGDSNKCAGVLVSWEVFLFWYDFQRLFASRVLDPVFVYFKELPTIVE